MNRQHYLLVIVGLLVVVRFLVVPGFAYMEEQRAQVDKLQQRYEKGQLRLATSEAIETSLTEVQNLLAQQKAVFPRYSDVDSAKLTIQKKLDQLAEEYDVDIENQEWLFHREGFPAVSEMQIRVSAKTENFVYFQLALEQSGKWQKTESLRLQVRKQVLRQKRLGTTTGNLVYKFYYVVESGDA